MVHTNVYKCLKKFPCIERRLRKFPKIFYIERIPRDFEFRKFPGLCSHEGFFKNIHSYENHS